MKVQTRSEDEQVEDKGDDGKRHTNICQKDKEIQRRITA